MADRPENAIHPLTRPNGAWLEANYTQSNGVWLVSYKKATGKPTAAYNDVVEEALCFGWIDSKRNKLDDERAMLWFAPRKGSTGWSRPNKQRIERMIAAGLMTPAGQAKVDAAKTDGSWTTLDAIENGEAPGQLVALNKRRATGLQPAARPRRSSVLPGVTPYPPTATACSTGKRCSSQSSTEG